MRNKLMIISCFAFLPLSYACNVGCRGKKIPLGLIYANKNDSLKIVVDKRIVVDQIIKEYYNGHFEDEKDRLTTLCLNKDAVYVTVKINARDTSFYLYPKKIKEFYVGCSMKGIIQVYYNSEEGGFGKYDPKQ